MIEIFHPQVVLSPEEDITVERAFVEETLELVEKYGIEDMLMIGKHVAEYKATERVDFDSCVPAESVAFRLRAIPTFGYLAVAGAETNLVSVTRSNDVVAVLLEYGYLPAEYFDEELEEQQDSSFVWNPYVLAVAETGQREDCDGNLETWVLDPRTGVSLSTDDLAKAQQALTAVHGQLRGQDFFEVLPKLAVQYVRPDQLSCIPFRRDDDNPYALADEPMPKDSDAVYPVFN